MAFKHPQKCTHPDKRPSCIDKSLLPCPTLSGAFSLDLCIQISVNHTHIIFPLTHGSTSNARLDSTNKNKTTVYLRRGGRKPAAARRVSLFLAGVAAQDTWPAACEPAVPRMRGGVCNGDGGSREASRAALGKRNAIRCVLCWCRSSSQSNGMCLSHAERYASYGSWKATSALAKGKYRLSSSGGIPRARRARAERSSP